MVRTKSTASYKVIIGKTPKMQAACKTACSGGNSGGASSSSSTPSKRRSYIGGNPVKKRETPEWQKEITCFFPAKTDEQLSTSDDGEPPEEQATQAGSSGTQ